MRRLAMLAVALGLAGCQQPDGQGEGTVEPAAETASRPAAAPNDAEPPPTPRLALGAEGLAALSSAEFPNLAFGASRAEVEDALRQALGGTPQRTRNEECGAGPMEFTQFGALTANFQDGRFVGWFARDGATIPTIDGILPGVTRAELERERSVDVVEDSTLDGEFEYSLPDGSTIGGFLDGAGTQARVSSLHAGTNCFFR